MGGWYHLPISKSAVIAAKLTFFGIFFQICASISINMCHPQFFFKWLPGSAATGGSVGRWKHPPIGIADISWEHMEYLRDFVKQWVHISQFHFKVEVNKKEQEKIKFQILSNLPGFLHLESSFSYFSCFSGQSRDIQEYPRLSLVYENNLFTGHQDSKYSYLLYYNECI